MMPSKNLTNQIQQRFYYLISILAYDERKALMVKLEHDVDSIELETQKLQSELQALQAKRQEQTFELLNKINTHPNDDIEDVTEDEGRKGAAAARVANDLCMHQSRRFTTRRNVHNFFSALHLQLSRNRCMRRSLATFAAAPVLTCILLVYPTPIQPFIHLVLLAVKFH